MTNKRLRELKKAREERDRLALTPAAGKTGKVCKARKHHSCVACLKTNKIKPGQIYIARSVFIIPPKYPVRLAYCKSCSSEYAKKPEVLERALCRAAGVEPQDTGVHVHRKGVPVKKFEEMCRSYFDSYRWLKKNIWSQMKYASKRRKRMKDAEKGLSVTL